jgi:hypothetical protein
MMKEGGEPHILNKRVGWQRRKISVGWALPVIPLNGNEKTWKDDMHDICFMIWFMRVFMLDVLVFICVWMEMNISIRSQLECIWWFMVLRLDVHICLFFAIIHGGMYNCIYIYRHNYGVYFTSWMFWMFYKRYQTTSKWCCKHMVDSEVGSLQKISGFYPLRTVESIFFSPMLSWVSAIA